MNEAAETYLTVFQIDQEFVFVQSENDEFFDNLIQKIAHDFI